MALTNNGIIINADSMQLYRYLDIGTAKPSRTQIEKVKHLMVDIVDPDEEYNAGNYEQEALGEIYKLSSDSNLILTGGTFLYIRALLSGLIKGVKSDQALRKKLKNKLKNAGLSELYKDLEEIDHETAESTDSNDHIRIIRALEQYYLTGEKPSDLKKKYGFREDRFNTYKIALYEDREKIRKNIDERVEDMFKLGFVDEVKTLRNMGYGKDLKSMQSIGYKQVNDFLDNIISIDEAKYLIKRDTKRYAKRQMTWLRKETGIRWFRPVEDLQKIKDFASRFFES